ncbi:MAG: mechanosensitive ion channel [Planctomycetes bacterium]|nr:mechanosensitive ion channel [Planctomycetota bacterium]
MRSLRALLLLAPVLWLTAATGALRAQEPGTAPRTDPDAITALRAELDAATGLTDEQRQRARTELDQASADLAAESEWRRKLKDLQDTVRGAPREIARIQGRLSVPPGFVTTRDYETISQYETAIQEAQTARDEQARTVEALTRSIDARQARQREIPQIVADLEARLQTNAAALAETPPPDLPALLQTIHVAALRAQSQALAARLDHVRVEQSGGDLLQGLEREQRSEAQRLQDRGDARIQELRRKLEPLRQAQIDLAREAIDGWEKSLAQDDPLRSMLQECRELVDSLGREYQLLAEATRRRDGIAADEKELSSDFKAAKERADVAGLSMGVGLELRALRAQLLDELARWRRLRGSLRADVVAAHDDRFDDEKRLRKAEAQVAALADALRDNRERRAGLLPRLSSPGGDAAATAELARLDAAAERLQLESAIQTRLRDLLQTRLEPRRQRASVLVTADTTLSMLFDEAQTCLDFVTERVLWVRDARAVWSEPTTTFTGELGHLARTLLGELTRLRAGFGEGASAGFWVLAALATLGFALRSFARMRLRKLGEAASRRSNTSILPTWRAVIATMALALPGPLLLLAFADVAERPWYSASGALFVLELLRQSARSDGLGGRHFDWREDKGKLLRRNLAWLTPIVVLATIVLRRPGDDDAERALGADRMALAIADVALAVFAARLLRPQVGLLAPASQDDGPSPRVRRLLQLTAVAVPLALAGFALAGFSFTARTVFVRLLATLLLIGAAVLLHDLVIRWLQLSRRALAIERAKEAHRAKQASVTGPALPGTEGVAATDLATIDQQTRTLVRVAAQVIVLVGAWLLWSDVLPAFGILGDYSLWSEMVQEQTVVHDPGGDRVVTNVVQRAVTLEAVLLAMVIGAVTWVLARNIGGLLEVAVFRHLEIRAGERYAIRTIVGYVVGLVGIVLAFSTIGLGWGQVQWLVAAVSVGLGFGLQEIFANFVSGVILLLERPVRVGDFVTVGNTDGKVTRIQMRATTITDFDRKELVVPNREFITSRFVNWSLSNPITRLVIPVGIAYGSDTRKARELMLAAANSCPTVLATPKPNVVYRRFGDSALEFELRIFIASLDDWGDAMNDVHTAVDDALRAAGIEIAFPQMDLHLRSLPPRTDRLAGMLSLEPTQPDGGGGSEGADGTGGAGGAGGGAGTVGPREPRAPIQP